MEKVSSIKLENEGRGSNSAVLWTRPQVTLLQRALRNEDFFVLFIAAIGHDIGHPGVNNAFLVNRGILVYFMGTERQSLEKCENAVGRTFQ